MPKVNAIGIDLGGTNLRVALVSRRGEVLRKIKEPSKGDVMAALKLAVESLAEEETRGVGIGVAGLIDREEMRVISSPNLPRLNGKSFRELGLRLPLAIENDANAAAMGEKWLGAGRGFRSFVLLTLGTGIGCGIVHNGKLLGIAAEAGHMSISAGGEKCLCGNYGCLEQYAGARAITDAATRALEKGAGSMLSECCEGNIYRITSEDVFRTALEGDALSRDILKEAGKYLGVGISNLVNIFSPEAVILSGGLIGAWDIYVKEAMNEASRRSFRGLVKGVEIIPSSLGGDDAGIIGAAGLVLHGN
jgi:glucokinase